MKMPSKFVAIATVTVSLAACTPSDQDMCAHIMDVMKQELGAAEDAELPSDADMQTHTTKCVKDLRKERDAKGDTYGEFAKCIMAATTIEEMVICDAEEEEEV